MNQPNSVIIRYDILRSLNWNLITPNYVAVGGICNYPIRILKIRNKTNTNLIFSFDGINDHDAIPANTYDVTDFGANKSEQGGFLELPSLENFYVKAELGVLPTSGKVYITVLYVSQN